MDATTELRALGKVTTATLGVLYFNRYEPGGAGWDYRD